MAKVTLGLLVLFTLTACGSAPVQRAPHPCDAGEATYACQVERYNHAR